MISARERDGTPERAREGTPRRATVTGKVLERNGRGQLRKGNKGDDND
jgi:hypothetical protein